MVVIYLGMRVNAWRGLLTVFGFGPKIQKAVADKPDGLLLHEDLIWSIFPFHLGMRQYWRDFDALERWARSEPHRQWWAHFVRDSGGTGFWHETHFMRGGMEAVYGDMPQDIGLLKFAPSMPARGAMFSARLRGAQAAAPAAPPAPVHEPDLYPH